MASIGDYQLERSGRPGRIHLEERRAVWPWLLLLIAIGGAAGAFVYYRYWRPAPAPAAQAAAAPAHAASPAAAKPLGGDPDAIDLPPLDQTDDVVRALMQTLSSSPTIAAWLATDGLIRNFTVVVSNIANERTPVQHLAVLKPAGRFKAASSGNDLRIDPASYHRYDQIAAAVSGIDAQSAARVYATLKPRIEEAAGDLGENEPFDGILEAALVQLVRTPVSSLPENAAVRQKGAEGYQYVDARLEALTPPQKILLRMGPRNAATIQAKLREIAIALGIPEERLR